jgi:hypothetical protein
MDGIFGKDRVSIMSKPDPSRPQSMSGRERSPWGRVATTLVLLLIMIVAGMAAYSSRQQWWEMYLSYIGK